MADDGTATRARIVGEVCARILGGESVDQCFAAPDPGWPSERTFWRWIADKDLRQPYLDAIAARGLYYGEIAASFSRQAPAVIVSESGTRIDPAWVQLQKNRADDCRWIALRMQPKLYGDRTTIAGDADNPIAFVNQSAIAGKLLPELAGDGTATPPGDADGGGAGES